MFNESMLPEATGMPTGKRKRKRGGRGKGGPGADHHANLNRAMAAGDHAGAKKHALNLANSLHGHVTKTAPPTVPKMSTASTPVHAPPSTKPAGSAFLASALIKRR